MAMKIYSDVVVSGIAQATTQGSDDTSVVLLGGHKVLTGSGAPSTSTAGIKGQMYRDTAADWFYVCTDVSNPGTVSASYTWVRVAGDEILIGDTAPTTATVGKLGQLYVDKVSCLVYVCTAISTTSPITYTWESTGAKVTLNGTTTTNPSFYAPTGPGDSGQLLRSNGENAAPEWVTIAGPMQFKGTVGDASATVDPTVTWANLPEPTAGNAGFAYKVITAHTVRDPSWSPICKVGDMIISDGSTWVVIPSGDDPGISQINTGTGLTGGPITTSGTISVDTNYVLGKTVTTEQTVAGEVSSVKTEGIPLADTAFRNITAGTSAPSASSGSIGDIYVQYGSDPHIGSQTIGSSTQPVYIYLGVPTACDGYVVKRTTGTITWAANEVSRTISNLGYVPKIVQVYEKETTEGVVSYHQVGVDVQIGTDSTGVFTITLANALTAGTEWLYQVIGW